MTANTFAAAQLERIASALEDIANELPRIAPALERIADHIDRQQLDHEAEVVARFDALKQEYERADRICARYDAAMPDTPSTALAQAYNATDNHRLSTWRGLGEYWQANEATLRRAGRSLP